MSFKSRLVVVGASGAFLVFRFVMIMIKAKKVRMSQVWLNEKVVPFTYLKASEADLEKLEVEDRVKIIGKTKGRGFAGVVKRHGFSGGPKTHGQSDRWRAPGSLGGTTTPGRVYKGKRMAGRMGSEKRTLKSTVLVVEKEKNLIGISGPVPGSSGSLVFLEKITK